MIINNIKHIPGSTGKRKSQQHSPSLNFDINQDIFDRNKDAIESVINQHCGEDSWGNSLVVENGQSLVRFYLPIDLTEGLILDLNKIAIPIQI